MPWRGGSAGWPATAGFPGIVRAARSSPFITKVAEDMKLTKKELLIRASGHERSRNMARLWRRPRISRSCFATFTVFASFVIAITDPGIAGSSGKGQRNLRPGRILGL
jgi:hypothetical protein